MAKSTLVEVSTGLVESPSQSGLYEIRLIASDVQGSSGYYSGAVLERDGAAAFPKGTKIFLDHPSRDDADNRPERSVRDIAGFLTETPAMGDDGLYGKVKFGRSYAHIVEDFGPYLGMSIRASGEIEEAEDASGIMVKKVSAIYPSPMNSVDVVTAAGANGAIIEALHESIRETISEDKEPKGNIPMDEKDIEKIVAAIMEANKPFYTAVTTIAESLKPVEEEGTETDMAAVTESAIEAGLTKSARARVVASVKAGISVEEAIKAETDIRAEILAEAGTDNGEQSQGGTVRTSSNLNEAFDSLSIFGGK